MRIIQLFALFLIVGTNISIAQNSKIKWGPEFESKSWNEFVGEDEKYIYLLNSVDANSGGKKSRILKIDKRSKEMVEKIEFKKKLKPYRQIMDLQLKDGYFEVVSYQKKSIVKVKFSRDGTIKDEEVLLTFKKKMKLNSGRVSKGFYSIEKPFVSSRISSDQSKFAIRVKYPKDRADKYVYYVYDKNDQYKLIHEFVFELERKTKKEVLIHDLLTANGKVIFLVKEYLTNKEKEEKNDMPNYKFRLLSGLPGGEKVELDLGPSAHFVKMAFFSIAEDQSFIIASLTETKPDKGAEGILIHKFDPEGNFLFDKYYPLKDIKTDKKDHLETYNLSKIIQCSEGAFMIVVTSLEIVSPTSSVSSSNNLSYSQKFYHVTKDMVINYFDAQGNYVWSKSITRNSREMNNFYFSIPQVMADNDGGADFYFNTDIRNVNSFEDPDADDFYLRSKENVIVKASFTKDGNVEYKALTDQSKYGLAHYGIEKYGDVTYFIGMDRKYRKIKVGELR